MADPSNEVVLTKPVFKFLSLADNQSPSWQERVEQLLDGKAYHPSPSQFNDPFDCIPRIQMPKTMEELKAKQNLLVERFVKNVPHHAPEMIRQTLADTLDRVSLETLTDQIFNTVRATANEMGVFSLAANISNVLMWSHYASNHGGIALRFDMSIQPRDGISPLFKVHYQDERPAILNFFDEGFGDDSDELFNALRIKAKFWEYEEEWRSIQPGMAGQLVDFDHRVITSVVLGANCTDENEIWLRNMMKRRGLAVLKAVPDRETFAIRLAAMPDDFALLRATLRNFPTSGETTPIV